MDVCSPKYGDTVIGFDPSPYISMEYGKRWKIVAYPLVNIQKAMENHHFNGFIN